MCVFVYCFTINSDYFPKRYHCICFCDTDVVRCVGRRRICKHLNEFRSLDSESDMLTRPRERRAGFGSRQDREIFLFSEKFVQVLRSTQPPV